MGSVVSYANEIKSEWLGVKEQTLIKYGAVSKECVEEMLRGVLKLAHADHGIAVSGIAGPTGGSDEKPIGTVYLGVNIKGTITIEQHLFSGDRESVQKQATDTAIALFKNKL